MKLRSIILVLSVSLIACHNNSNKEATQEPFKIAADSSDYLPDHNSTHLNSPYDTTGILTQLLDPDSIVDNVAIWRPDAEAKFNMNVSEDGNCYTNIDTIIKFPDNGWPDYLVILTTYLCDSAGEHFGGHSCAVDYGMATIVKNDSSSEKREKVSDYKIYSFKRDLSHFGEYGQGAKVSVENFGEDVLRISDQYYGQGEEGTNDSYFSITDGDNDGKKPITIVSWSDGQSVSKGGQNK